MSSIANLNDIEKSKLRAELESTKKQLHEAEDHFNKLKVISKKALEEFNIVKEDYSRESKLRESLEKGFHELQESYKIEVEERRRLESILQSFQSSLPSSPSSPPSSGSASTSSTTSKPEQQKILELEKDKLKAEIVKEISLKSKLELELQNTASKLSNELQAKKLLEAEVDRLREMLNSEVSQREQLASLLAQSVGMQEQQQQHKGKEKPSGHEKTKNQATHISELEGAISKLKEELASQLELKRQAEQLVNQLREVVVEEEAALQTQVKRNKELEGRVELLEKKFKKGENDEEDPFMAAEVEELTLQKQTLLKEMEELASKKRILKMEVDELDGLKKKFHKEVVTEEAMLDMLGKGSARKVSLSDGQFNIPSKASSPSEKSSPAVSPSDRSGDPSLVIARPPRFDSLQSPTSDIQASTQNSASMSVAIPTSPPDLPPRPGKGPSNPTSPFTEIINSYGASSPTAASPTAASANPNSPLTPTSSPMHTINLSGRKKDKKKGALGLAKVQLAYQKLRDKIKADDEDEEGESGPALGKLGKKVSSSEPALFVASDSESTRSAGTASSGATLSNQNENDKSHIFQPQTFMKPVKCGGCGDKIWGLSGKESMFHRLALFGTDLTLQVQLESPRHIPIIVELCVKAVETRGLDIEGIYRKSGPISQLRFIQSEFEKGNVPDLSDIDVVGDIAAVTSSLKQYLRELPNPLITFGVYSLVLDAIRQPEDQVENAMREALNSLPVAHYNTLKFLIRHLVRVCDFSKENLMSPRNLGVVFGPTLMKESNNSELYDMNSINVVEYFIMHFDELFILPMRNLNGDSVEAETAKPETATDDIPESNSPVSRSASPDPSNGKAPTPTRFGSRPQSPSSSPLASTSNSASVSPVLQPQEINTGDLSKPLPSQPLQSSLSKRLVESLKKNASDGFVTDQSPQFLSAASSPMSSSAPSIDMEIEEGLGMDLYKSERDGENEKPIEYSV
ncbi:hypothetical protein BKA69DRAFT_1041324 [Paraphysoderma sedebokerense]|nr:hypothetical protein BKA69DRAFT_1041324 [Paraphysoderma sedebokerense]